MIGAYKNMEEEIIMKLKPEIDLSAFLKTIQSCTNDVIFETDEGDRLNLKSTLSQFIFTAAVAARLPDIPGRICCDGQDVPLLQKFLMA